MNNGGPGAMIGKEITVSISGFSMEVSSEDEDKYEDIPVSSDTFTLHWTLRGSDKIRVVDYGSDTVSELSGSGAGADFTARKSSSDGSIGNTGAVIKQAGMSRVIDPDEVDAILFPNNTLGQKLEDGYDGDVSAEGFGYSSLTEDDFWAVPLR